MRARVAAVNRRRLRAGCACAEASVPTVGTVTTDLGGRPLRFDPSARIPSMARTCSMCHSMVCFCASNPASAACSTSELKSPVCVGMTPSMTQVMTHLGYRDSARLSTGRPFYMNRITGVGVTVLTNALGTPLNPTGPALRSLDILSK